MTHPPYLSPFVLSEPVAAIEHRDQFDLYLPTRVGPRPAVIFVHGGPVAADIEVTPRDWPIYVGYGSAVARRGCVGVMFNHPLHGATDYPTCADVVAAVVDEVRRDDRVDAVALWFFSGGGLLMADWLRDPPPWLKCVAATYPLVGTPPEYGIDARFRPIEAVASVVGDLPIVLTRVGLEREHIAAYVEAFVNAAQQAKARLEIIDVPNGQHAFDQLDHTEESRAAVRRAVDTVTSILDPSVDL